MVTLEDALDVVGKWKPLAEKIIGRDADDVLQVARIAVWKNFHKFDPRFTLNTWIGTIVRNKAITALRDSQRFKRGVLFCDCSVYNQKTKTWEVPTEFGRDIWNSLTRL